MDGTFLPNTPLSVERVGRHQQPIPIHRTKNQTWIQELSCLRLESVRIMILVDFLFMKRTCLSLLGVLRVLLKQLDFDRSICRRPSFSYHCFILVVSNED
jgi:hypothetical protein